MDIQKNVTVQAVQNQIYAVMYAVRKAAVLQRNWTANMFMMKSAAMFLQQQALLVLMYVKSATRQQRKKINVSVKQSAQKAKETMIAPYAAEKTGISLSAWVRHLRCFFLQ